ncbi:hypothetical protein MCOR25_010222 [Pyricularia grisea]|uniref:Uncharacterized protein n=1 Tax=Pyricularia grisea TaxID=148305 RepID=A0A6P8APJ7_PYRGI|nr:hypothetical protein PgNI_11407 [Pyricularia grisea]KAI6351006.1 hypothetical protein MCOR25_010222 [Pyricularia grisea]TLD03969.1 hypothetical protein PgNI_11407 [Pyricularia grisea]
MRASFITVAMAAVAAQAAPSVIEARDDVAPTDSAAAPAASSVIPAACTPTPGIDIVAAYDKAFEFQKAYLFDKNNNETFKYYSADFKSNWRFGSYTRDEYWATQGVQTWMAVSSYPTESYFKNDTLHVAYDLGVNRTGHAGDNFVWKDGCVISQEQTRS